MADAEVVAGGSKGKKLNQLNKPFDVHFSQGSLYVADMMNHRVLAFKAGSTQGTLVAGTGKKGDSLDKLRAILAMSSAMSHGAHSSKPPPPSPCRWTLTTG